MKRIWDWVLQRFVFDNTDYVDGLKGELDRVNKEFAIEEDKARVWRSLATGTHRDLILAELTALEDKEEVITQHETPNPYEIAMLDGEMRGYRKIQVSMELRARTLGLEMQIRPDDDPRRKR